MQLRFVFLPVWVGVFLLAGAFPAVAQSEDLSEWNHFDLDFRLGLNIKARFSNLGASAALPAPPLAGNVDHTYADGFVRPDSSGDKDGVTWNWGYRSASQVSGNDTLVMHAAGTPGGSVESSSDPRLGFQADYARDVAHFNGGRWGFKLAIGYTDLKIRDTQSLTANESLISDSYSLDGITAPVAPYTGSFAGPGPVIADTPTRSIGVVQGGALITGSRQLDAWLYDLHFGPYLELPLVSKVTVQLGGGVAAGLVDSTFTFSDSTSTAGGVSKASGSNQTTDALVGFYGEAGLAYHIMPSASLFAGGQFQYLGQFNQTAEGRQAQLDLRRSIFFVVGVQWHF